MKDRRQNHRIICSSESAAVAQYRQHQAACLADILLARCGIEVLREEVRAEVEVPASGTSPA